MKTKFIFYTLFFNLIITAAFSQHYDLIDQNGSDNKSLVIQNFDLNNTTFIGNDAYSIQDGDRNTGLIDQFGDDNKAFAYQTYADHDAVILIAGKRNISLVIQSGENDEAFIRQIGLDNLAYAVQAGDNNSAKVYMNAESSRSTVKQYGEANQAFQIMGDGFIDFISTTNGNVNDDRVKNSSFKIQQDGDRNYADQLMEGSGTSPVLNTDNTGIIDQSEDDNKGYQKIKNHLTEGIAKNNYVYLIQDGDANFSTQSIWGSDNNSSNYQLSSNNYSSVTIQGNYNVSTSTQQ